MLEQSEQILSKFREINSRGFYDCAKDIIPIGPFNPLEGSAYGKFDEEEEVYEAMHALAMGLANAGYSFFFGGFKQNYSNPMEVINPLLSYRKDTAYWVSHLTTLHNKYKGQNIPVAMALSNFGKTLQMIDYVLALPEVKSELPTDDSANLKSEIISLNFRYVNPWKSTLIYFRVVVWFLFIFVPLSLILYFWDLYAQEKWFGLVLFIYPLIASLSDRQRFVEDLKFVFSKTSRQMMREKWKIEISKSYNF